MDHSDYYCNCSVCRLLKRRTMRTLLWGVEEGLKGITFAGILALAVTIFAGSPHQLFVGPKTHHRIEQLTELHRQLLAVTRELENLSQQHGRLYTHLLHTSPQLAGLESDTVPPSRRFYLAGAAPPPIDSTVFVLTDAVDRLKREVIRQQQIADRHAEWVEQSPVVLPADGAIASGFGMRHHPLHGERRLHEGIDIDLPGGSPVLATGAGVVTVADTADGYGYHVRILHPATGHLTLYAHLSEVPEYIEPGQWINRGETVGYSGDSGRATGPHLHYEIRNAEGRALDPMNFLLPSRRDRVPRPHHAFTRIDSLLRHAGV